ncbi:MAG: AbrB/MazE/SpoVT family DNA-binding domain-containing protein [Candidatus Omnitrophota bacterium]|jgi:AbrB family looped-hinge helix DNA binding protein
MNGFFKGKVYGTATVGERGQFVIPMDLRKDLDIKAGDRLMIFAKVDRKMISIMREKDFSDFLQKASKVISKLESRVGKK